MLSIFRNTLLVALVLFVGEGTLAKADYFAYHTAYLTGNQAWLGNLGLDFDVVFPIMVTRLGAYDSTGDGFLLPITVGLYQRSTTTPTPPITVGNPDTEHYGALLASVTLTGTPGPLVDGYRYTPLTTPLLLQPGHYSVSAVGFNGPPPNENGNENVPTFVVTTDNGGGTVAFVGSGRWDSNVSLDYPYKSGHNWGYPTLSPDVFAAGSFAFVIPEPTGVVAILGLTGMGLVGLLWRRRRSAV